jgi:hypothetical protein
MNKYIGILMNSRTHAHIYHLETNSYAKHVALQEYYEEIVPLIDGIAETYQGLHGIISDIHCKEITPTRNNREMVTYFTTLQEYCTAVRESLPQDNALIHQYDAVDTLIATTIYKLKFLA